jgi:adenylate cyclase
MQRLNREDFAAARALLDQAVAKDPGYAAAHTLLARWYMLNLGQGYSAREHAEQNSFLKSVSRAVELNPADAHALALLGHCKSWLYRDYDAALDCFELAFSASPNSAFAWGWSSPTCSYLGDGETAVAHAEHALRLSPLGPNAYVYHSALALAHYTDGAYAEAARWGRRTLAIAPGYAANLRILVASLAAAGNVEEAKAAAETLLAMQPEFRARRFALGYSFKAKERNLALAEHLMLAGLPE